MAKISSEKLNSKIPEGPLAEKWTNYKAHQKLSTLKPIAPNEAAADAPARPVPTTMMSRLRLLAGLTNF